MGIVNTFHIESGHIACNALQWPVNLHFSHKQVWINLERVSGSLVFIIF